MHRVFLVAAVAVALASAGCATTTRVARMGMLGGDERLVTLVVTEDRDVVREQCRGIPAAGPILGCTVWRPLERPGEPPVRLIKIVRYTDALPSPLALEIDVHELCHAIAALQPIPDPCHIGNDGIIQAAAHDPSLFKR